MLINKSSAATNWDLVIINRGASLYCFGHFHNLIRKLSHPHKHTNVLAPSNRVVGIDMYSFLCRPVAAVLDYKQAPALIAVGMSFSRGSRC